MAVRTAYGRAWVCGRRRQQPRCYWTQVLEEAASARAAASAATSAARASSPAALPAGRLGELAFLVSDCTHSSSSPDWPHTLGQRGGVDGLWFEKWYYVPPHSTEKAWACQKSLSASASDCRKSFKSVCAACHLLLYSYCTFVLLLLLLLLPLLRTLI